MATINYTRNLSGRDFEITTENFNINGRILILTDGGAIDSLTGHIGRKGGNFHVGSVGYRNETPVFRFDEYITAGEADEIASAVNGLFAEEE